MLASYSRRDLESLLAALDEIRAGVLKQRAVGVAAGHYHDANFWVGCHDGLERAGDLLRGLLGQAPRRASPPKPLGDILDSPELAERGLDPLTLAYKEIALRGGWQFDGPPWMAFTVGDDSTPFRLEVERHERRWEADIYLENVNRPTYWLLFQAGEPAASPEAAVADSLRFWPRHRRWLADAEAAVRRITGETEEDG